MHPWVNFEQILNKCFIGPLKTHVEFDPSEVFKVSEKPAPKPEKELVNTSNEETVQHATTKEPIVLPKFDWIQKLDFITIIFYTGNFSNPLIEINRIDDRILNIYLSYKDNFYENELNFFEKILWPPQTKVTYETGKIEMVFRKVQGTIWENFGVLKQTCKTSRHSLIESRIKCKVINKTKVNHNTFLIELERSDNNRCIVPLGNHIKVFETIKGKYFSNNDNTRT